MLKGKVPPTHHATNAMWSKWIALITQRVQMGNSNCPGILETITNWPEGGNFSLADEEEEEPEGTGSGKQPFGIPPDEWQKLQKVKANRVSLQNSKPSNWP
ncbi:hypothetical protein BTVI_38835 [Pitangus sulphuratus]|nr:hypothetical protein BTVI_38835 [Pitangus sulphuratus]